MDGGYQCQKCLTTKQDFAWRMILQINMADSSDNNWATCFQVSYPILVWSHSECPTLNLLTET